MAYLIVTDASLLLQNCVDDSQRHAPTLVRLEKGVRTLTLGVSVHHRSSTSKDGFIRTSDNQTSSEMAGTYTPHSRNDQSYDQNDSEVHNSISSRKAISQRLHKSPSADSIGQSHQEKSPAGRFQCPKCPKNFSRIENLTRHQANRELFQVR